MYHHSVVTARGMAENMAEAARVKGALEVAKGALEVAG